MRRERHQPDTFSALLLDIVNRYLSRATRKGVPAGKKSLAITVTLQPTERTLTDAEIEAVSNKIVAQVTKATGAMLRG